MGPMARAVEDLALTLPVISGVDWRDPAVVPLPLGDPREVDCSGLRVAFFIDNGIVTPTAETAAAVERVANALSGGGGAPAPVALVDESRPDAVPRTMATFSRLWSTYAPGWRAKLLQRAGLPPTPATPSLSGTITARPPGSRSPISTRSWRRIAPICWPISSNTT